MDLSFASVVFYLAAAITLLGASMVLVLPNPLRAAMALIVALGGLSVVYLMLHAPFVAVMQILIYAGAIIVLFVFVIMLLSMPESAARRGAGLVLGAGVAIAALALGVARGFDLGRLSFARSGENPALVRALPGDFGTVEQVGNQILTDFVLPFEMISVLLLVAVLGAVVIAKKRL